MVNENTKEFDFIVVKYDKEYYNLIEEIYRLHKDQKRKIFDYGSRVFTDEDIMDYVEHQLELNNAITFAAIDKEEDKVAGVITLDNIASTDDTIIRCNCHVVICRKYWGKTSREIIKQLMYKLDNEFIYDINRYEAFVPANNFGIIKLLKDVGFKCEGTLKKRLMFDNKKGIPTYYDELVFSRVKEK